MIQCRRLAYAIISTANVGAQAKYFETVLGLSRAVGDGARAVLSTQHGLECVVLERGDRITTLQISSAAFFSSGYATLSSSGKSILRDVAVTLKSGEFAAYRISVEGHTDDSPISTAQFQSNWELSTARAASVVRFFLEEGIPPRKLTAAGYAGTFPVAPNRTADGTVIPENQAKNRRVVIRLEKIDKAE